MSLRRRAAGEDELLGVRKTSAQQVSSFSDVQKPVVRHLHRGRAALGDVGW